LMVYGEKGLQSAKQLFEEYQEQTNQNSLVFFK